MPESTNSSGTTDPALVEVSGGAGRRRSKGARTRGQILEVAARLATVKGLDGLTIGELADATGLSKSGLYAHFGSKVDLQLATVAAAREVFMREVVQPALIAPAGLARVDRLCEAFISYVERDVFPGGCFFADAAAEFDTRPGPVRDAIARTQLEWIGLLEQLVGEAQAAGEMPDGDAGQIAFELNAVLVAANGGFLLHRDPRIFTRARRAIARLSGRPAA